MGRPKLTIEKFINRSNEIHDSFYNYNKTNLNGIQNKVIITCPTHGDFLQVAASHLKGSGCSKCSGNKKFTHNEFVMKANKIHNSIYKYPNNYEGNSTMIEIICSNHGIFNQTPNDHLSGRGCPKCANENRSIKKQYSIDDFILKSNIVHNGKYDYTKSYYINSKTYIKIICPLHGEFNQLPAEHIKGKGCKYCKSRFSRAVNDIKTLFENNDISFFMEYKFMDCKNIFPLPFDFYLKEHNICIEYDGEYHFVPKEHRGGIVELTKIQFRDSIKTEYCENNNITLLRINYMEDHNLIINTLIGVLNAK